MSFSKARIQRFNERENNVPPPGAYDPKFDTKVKGLVIEKTGRFHDNRSVASAECNLSISTRSTSNEVTCFRTPQLPRKKVTPRPNTKVNPKVNRSLITTSDKKLKYKSEHQLADLQVECLNKNETIQEHEKHIECIKVEVGKLELQLEESLKKQVEVEEQHKKDIETMAKLQQEILNSHDEKHEVEIERLRCQLLDVSEEKEREIQTRKVTERDLRCRIADFSKRVIALESELINERRINKEKIHSLQAQIKDLKIKLEELTESHEQEIHLLEQEKSEFDSRVTNLTDELAKCEEKLEKVITESEAKVSWTHVNSMIRDAKTVIEEEMRLSTERYEARLAQMETDRTALVEKLEQKDAEITRLSMTLEELRSSAETQESFGQSLQMELDRAETQLAEKKEELRALKNQIRSEAAEMVARRKRFEVIMAENQASVAALTKRLAQSNAEVERLQHELKRGEDCINEHLDILNIMRNNSDLAYVQVHALMEQLDAKKGLVNQLEAESLSEVESIRFIFEAKIEDLKQIATKKVTKLQADYDAKNAQNAEMKNQLWEMANRLNEAQDMLLKLEEGYDAQELEISRMELLNSKLDKQLKKSKAALKETNNLLEDQSAKHNATLSKAHSKIQEISAKIKHFEEKDSSIQETIELLEKERGRREAAEAEVKKLIESNTHLRKDFREISEKYAEIVGHQNHKQKIKHVCQLKDKINQLEQDSRAMKRTIEQQQKIIEKLKAEEKHAHTKEKENTIEIPKTVHTTPVSSPHKLLAPLRSRNE